jgi:hypothetical protein
MPKEVAAGDMSIVVRLSNDMGGRGLYWLHVNLSCTSRGAHGHIWQNRLSNMCSVLEKLDSK